MSGYLPAGGGIIAGVLLLFAVTVQQNKPEQRAAAPAAKPVRQAVVSLPRVEPAPKPAGASSRSLVLLPPNPAATEVTRRIEAGLPLSNPPSKPVVIRKPADNGIAKPDDRRPEIALVMDDMGYDRVHSAQAVRLPSAVTLSYLPNAPDVQRQVRVARLRGHPVMLHLPMEAPSHKGRPGVNVLALKGSERILRERMTRMLASFDGYIGVNNHMGSRFTRDPDRMKIVLSELRRRGLFFLDSRTSNRSVGGETAREARVAYAVRDVFIDHDPEPENIRARLSETERLARRKGSAIAIAHPRPATMKLLEPWVRQLADKGFKLVPVTKLLKRPPPNKLAQFQPAE
ncbi:MAG: divergent polysaccharide deacetylase family protein [Alphaproteobacteria bacterium]